MKRKLVTLIMVVMSCLVLSGCGMKTINLNDYVKVEYKGLNTRGEAYLDEEALKEGVESVIYENAKKDTDINASLKKVMSACRFELNKEENLSNGDTVTVTAKINNELCKSEKIKLEFTEYTDTVNGLKEVPIYTDKDLFSAVKVIFDGISPEISVILDRNDVDDPYLNQMYYYIDGARSELKAGDEITVVCDAHDTNNYLVDKNATLEKKYVVENVAEYINSVDQVTEDVLNAGIEVTVDKMKAVMYGRGSFGNVYNHDEKSYNNYVAENIEQIECVKALLLTPKEGRTVREKNYIIYVYEFDFTSSNRNGFSRPTETFPDSVFGIITKSNYINVDGSVEKPIYDQLSYTSKYTDYEDWYQKEVREKFESLYDIIEIPVSFQVES